jgi:hypothetical protein
LHINCCWVLLSCSVVFEIIDSLYPRGHGRARYRTKLPVGDGLSRECEKKILIQEARFASPHLSDFDVQAKILVGSIYADKQ